MIWFILNKKYEWSLVLTIKTNSSRIWKSYTMQRYLNRPPFLKARKEQNMFDSKGFHLDLITLHLSIVDCYWQKLFFDRCVYMYIQEATRNLEIMDFFKRLSHERRGVYLSLRLVTAIAFTHCITVTARRILKYGQMSSRVVLHVEGSVIIRLLWTKSKSREELVDTNLVICNWIKWR
jgi:hypothetical protein